MASAARTRLSCLQSAADAILANLGPAPEVYDEVYWIQRRTAEARRDMGEARWQQLNAEWLDGPDRHALSPERWAQLNREWNA